MPTKRTPKPRKHSHASRGGALLPARAHATRRPKPQPVTEALAIRVFRQLMEDVTDWHALPDAFKDFDALATRHPTVDRDRLGALLIATDHVFLEIMRHHASPILGARRPIPRGDQR
jgi:hypothetical protein